MTLTEQIHECGELSQELKKMLTRADILQFLDLTQLSRLDLRAKVPKLKVRHLAYLECQMQKRQLDFRPDESILLDEIICQRDLFNLWEMGIDTYPKLDRLPYTEFVGVMGGPQSGFIRNKALAKAWMEKHGLRNQKH